ncbi:MAG: hypothetical protein ABI811_05170 [Acidobacteriota bacterium]
MTPLPPAGNPPLLAVIRFAIALLYLVGAGLAASQIFIASLAADDSSASLQSALLIEQRLTAINVRHLQRLADLLPEQHIALLAEATRIHPRSAALWIDLGLALERTGDLAQSERALLTAASFDHRHQPAWTLANFYFRGNQSKPFWQWAARAAALTFDDYRPLLRLADAWDSSPPSLVRRLGNTQPLLRAYLDFLIGEHRLDDAQQAANLLAQHHDPADSARLAALAQLRPTH